MSTPKGRTSARQQFSKREAVREMRRLQEVSSRHLRLSRILAVELFRTNPNHPVFTDDTFTEQSMGSIKLDARTLKTYEDMRRRYG